MTTIKQFAPAKINLYLHITGRRADGYHDLDSLVAFATIGDEVSLEPAPHFSFEITGAQSHALQCEDQSGNLVVAAARSLAELTGNELTVSLVLEKILPIASGIGGGSSDAAAALRALADFWRIDRHNPIVSAAALRHGQDVPVCLKIENSYMTATGVVSAPVLPRVPVVLINPNQALSTPSVYKEYKTGGDSFSPLSRLEQPPKTIVELIHALKARRNDLFAPACRLMPEITQIVEELEKDKSCLLARMSGSGATCFGLYETDEAAKKAADRIKAAQPGWWVEAGALNSLDQ